MAEFDPLDTHFPPQILRAIDIRLNDVEYACGLLSKANEIRQSKMPPVTYSSMTPEAQAAACMSGNYMGGTDVFALANNGLKEFRARRFERTAYEILDDDTY